MNNPFNTLYNGTMRTKDILKVYGCLLIYDDLKHLTYDTDNIAEVFLSMNMTKSNIYLLHLTLIIDNILITDRLIIKRDELKHILSKMAFYTIGDVESQHKNPLIKNEIDKMKNNEIEVNI